MMTKDGSQSPPETFARNNSIRYLKSNLYIVFIYLFCYWSDDGVACIVCLSRHRRQTEFSFNYPAPHYSVIIL